MDELTELLLLAGDGDEAAFAKLVQAMYEPIWRFNAHLVGRDDAADATQETFLSAWRSMRGFRGESSARTWLFVVARRSADRTARRRARWQELASSAPLAAPIALGPDSALEIEELLSGLPEERRIAMVLTQIVGLTYAEAAEVCGCPVGTIRSRIARAREDLGAVGPVASRRRGTAKP